MQVFVFEFVPVPEQAGVDELEEVPQLAEMVLDGCAREDESALGVEVHRGRAHAGVAVLDLVGLVEAHNVPLLARKQFALRSQHAVGGEDELPGTGGRDAVLPVVDVVQDRHLKGRGEADRLDVPVGDD